MTATLERIGFMQGRLSGLVDGKIQAFPWDEWREEFSRAKALGLMRMEWTIDQERLRENPLTTEPGQQAILALSREHGVRIPSLTGDCFMQAPFWKVDAVVRDALVADLDLLIASCSRIGIEFIVIPLVDNGKIERESDSDTLKRVLLARSEQLARRNVKIVFRSDLPPRGSPGSWRRIQPTSSASTTTAATAPRSVMTATRRSAPTRRASSMCT